MKYTFNQINDYTGFANMPKFRNTTEVFAYFTEDNMKKKFGESNSMFNNEELKEMAHIVIENHWNINID